MLSIILLAILLSGSGCGEKASTSRLKVAVDATLVPMAFINDEKKLDGFEVELIRAVAKEAGWDIDLVNVEWAGLFGGLITRKYDLAISSVTILEERKERMAFSIPYLKSGVALVVRKDMEGVESLEDIKAKNLTVGAQLGTTAYFLLEKDPAIQVKGYQQYGHAVADMVNGEIDAALGESTATLYYKNQNNEIFQKIKMVVQIMTEEFYGIVLRKEDKKLLEQVNAALSTLLKNGTVSKLHDKWDLGQAASVPEIQ
ncbi:MAG: transporter substrate-binding domain-containing protein [Nitrospinales bacterium]